MARNILLRFDANEELIQIVDEVARRLGLTNSALTRLALFQYCKENLKDGKGKTKSGD